MKISIIEINEVATALQALDSYERPAKDGSDKLVKDFYVLSGKVRLKIGRMIAKLAPEVEAVRKAREDLLMQVSGGRGKIEAHETDIGGRFAQEVRAMYAEERDLDLDDLRLSEADLQLDKNPIQGSLLAALSPVLDLG